MNNAARLQSSRILPIQSLRGILAICIVLYHGEKAAYGSSWFMEPTALGVVAFFVMSGFLMAMRHGTDDGASGAAAYGHYLSRRARKLFPPHWLALALYVAFILVFHVQKSTNWVALVPNALLLQSWWPDASVYFSFNGVSWFLCDLLFCYACFPFVCRWLRRMALKWQLLIAVAVMLSLWTMMSHVIDLATISYVNEFPPVRLYEFSLGIVAYNCYEALRSRISNVTFTKATVAELLALGFLLGVMAFSKGWDYTFKKSFDGWLMWEIPVSVLILVMALMAGREGLVGHILSVKPLVWLGSISLEIYLFQYVAAFIYNYLAAPFCAHFGFEIYAYLPYGSFIILIPMAWLVHHLFKRK